MLQFTTIARASDGLVLGADTENNAGSELEKTKATAKNLLKKLSTQATSMPEALTVETSANAFHILFEGGVFFLTMCDPMSPTQLAYAYLEAVAKEFLHQHGQQVDAAKRPYYFIKFDMTLQKLKKQFNGAQYGNAPTARNSTPERKSFREVMGYGDGPGKSKGAGGGAATAEKELMVAVGVAVVAFIAVVGLVILAISYA